MENKLKSKLYVYISTLHKIAIEDFLQNYKERVTSLLEVNNFEAAKQIIREIENFNQFKKMIDEFMNKVVNLYNEGNDSELDHINEPISVNSSINYVEEILFIIEQEETVSSYNLKNYLFGNIFDHIDYIELDKSEILPNHLIWEYNFYKATAVIRKNGLAICNDDYWEITDKGKIYLNPDSEESETLKSSIADVSDIEIVPVEEEIVSSLRNFIASKLDYDEINEIDKIDKVSFECLFLVKKTISSESNSEVNWSLIKENNFYSLEDLFSKKIYQVMVIEKYNEFNMLKCIDDLNSIGFYVVV